VLNLDQQKDGARPRVTVQPINKSVYRQLTRNVNFTVLDPSTGQHHPLKPSVRKYLERWLLERASCPIRLVWNDMGALFWPRWVRRGECDDETTAGYSRDVIADSQHDKDKIIKSCSWPPGMRCVPEASRNIHLLRWQCRQAHHHRTSQSRWATSAVERSVVRRYSPAAKTSYKQQRGGSIVDSSTSGRQHRYYRLPMEAPLGSSAPDRMRCRWKKVPYPITTECFCSC